MPIVDMSIPELENYAGTNPRPTDFDDYWNRAKAQAKFLNPKMDICLSDFSPNSAHCFDLFFTGVGGARVHAKYLKPKGFNNCPVVLHFHGYGGCSASWADLLSFVAEGFAVLSLDVRGQSGESIDNLVVAGNTHLGHVVKGLDDSPEKLFYRNVFLDTYILAKIAATQLSEIDGNRIYCVGNSQGGALSLVCAALASEYIKKAVIQSPFLSDYLRVYHMDLCKDAYGDILKFLRYHDPMMVNTEDIFTRLGYIDIQFLAPRIKADVLFATGLMDTICPPSSQLAAYNKITSNKDIIYYPNHAHECFPNLSELTLNFFCEYDKNPTDTDVINKIISQTNEKYNK